MRKFIISALIFVLLFSLAAPNFTAAAAAPFSATESFTENGVEYKNVAVNKSYVPTGSAYSGKWTDTDDNGKPLGKLTDGVVAESGRDEAIGCYQGEETSVTIDLGKAYSIKRMATDLYGCDPWGIPDPGVATVSVSVSTDNKTFNNVGEAQKSDETVDGDFKLRMFTLTLNQTVSARYVRVTYKINGKFCWSSEIAVFGNEQPSADSQPSGSSQSSENSQSPVSSQPSNSSQSSGNSQSSVSSQATANTQSAVSSEDSSGELTPENSLTWLYILLGAVVLAAAAAVIVITLRKRKK